jgi:hypothetical protein
MKEALYFDGSTIGKQNKTIKLEVQLAMLPVTIHVLQNKRGIV